MNSEQPEGRAAPLTYSLQPTAYSLSAIGLLLAIVTSGPAAYGAETGAECISIADDPARLACYDREFGRSARAAAPAKAPAAAPAAEPPSRAAPAAAAGAAVAAPAEKVDPAATFGSEDLPQDRKEPTEQLDSLQARVVEVERNKYGKHYVRLDNGQAWRQVEATDLVPVRVGDTVEITRGAFDSYRMRRASGGRTVTVKRVE